jgi:hypothetical protein
VLPDVIVNVVDAPQPRSLPTDTGTAIFVGEAERGDNLAPVEIRSLAAFTATFGTRQANALLYDAVETFFQEGGSLCLVQRVTGAGAATATLTLLDGSAGSAAIVRAKGPGTWGNGAGGGLYAQVIAGAAAGEFVLVVYRGGTTSAFEVERSPSVPDVASLRGWSLKSSKYVEVLTSSSALDPAVLAATALASGTNGSAVVDADWQTALDRIPADLGPGQVCVPGRTTAAGQLQAIAHAVANNRFALLDAPDAASAATVVAAAQALYGAPNRGRRYFQMFAPWDVAPGLTATTLRTVPPCAAQAAAYARQDALGNPNQAAAGAKNNRGVRRWIVDLSQPAWTATERQSLSEAGVTVSRRRYGNAIVTFDVVTGADQVNDEGWKFAPNVRTVMAYVARAKNVGDLAEFDQLDGQGFALSDLRGGLMSIADGLFGVGALYGSTPSEARYVDVGAQLNTPSELQAGRMHASVALRVSPTAQQVIIDVVKVPITQELG